MRHKIAAKMVKTGPKSSAAGASKKEVNAKGLADDKAAVVVASEPQTKANKGKLAAAQTAGKTSKEPTKAAVKETEKTSKPAASAKVAEAEDHEDESELKSEVQGFLDGFNYDTDSDISEPEGLDEIDD